MRFASTVPVARIAMSVVSAVWLIASPLRAEVAWTCGEWTKDPTGKCLEKRTCTRSKCTDPQDLTTCTKETRTECVKEEAPPKPPTRFNGITPPTGQRPTTNDPGPGLAPGPANPGATTVDPYADRVIGCRVVGERVEITNLTGRWIAKGRFVRWRLSSGESGTARLDRDLAQNATATLTTVPQAASINRALTCEASLVRGVKY